MENTPLFSVKNFGVSFSQYKRGTEKTELKVITNLDIDLYEGKILAVVGSSGSGKSLLAHAIMGILPYNANVTGEMTFMGKKLESADIENLRGTTISLIPQSVNFLDPLLKVGAQVATSIRTGDDEEKKKAVEEVFERYGLAKEVYNYYPHQLSGGMARRVLLATATLAKSKIVIADEPTPGLDEVSLNEVLIDFKRLTQSGCAVLMITHDINAAKRIADDIAFFYAGSTLETAPADEVTGDGSKLRHPYSKALVRAMPDNEFVPLDGFQPMPGELSEGCVFAERCPQCCDKCMKKAPELQELRGGKVRCFYAT